MKRSLLVLNLSCLVLFVICGTAAHADTFAFAWESMGDFGIGSGSGTLTAVTDTNIPNALDVTSFSGTVDARPILGLLPCAHTIRATLVLALETVSSTTTCFTPAVPASSALRLWVLLA